MSSTGNVVAADGEIIRLLTNPVLRWRNWSRSRRPKERWPGTPTSR